MKELTMGIFSSFFCGGGLTNATSNMKNPLGYSKCRELCELYDNWGGYKTPSRLIIGTPTGPGMELYEIFKNDDGRQLFRGVIFASTYENGRPVVEPRVFSFEDLGDGGCPCFELIDVLVHVEEDLYRTQKRFTTYVNGKRMNTTGELNWNIRSNAFAYREIYTPAE